MAFDLENKKVLITGAGQGIGKASAILFMNAGAAVWATDIDQPLLNALKDEFPAIHTRILDVRDVEAINWIIHKAGALDVLFNCVGYVHEGNILACSGEDWEFSFNLNVTSMYRTCRAVLPSMIAAGKGNIINMASIVSSVKGAPNRCAYAASKAAVIGLTKAIATDFIANNIRCNALCPGTVDTPSLRERIGTKGDAEAVRASFVARQPMGRLGTSQEIAAAALYLASEESAFVTGQTFIIDGGWSI
jgi:2-keto-3-deoxy-L-fuconate dehydrogenase